ncbi:MAG TPA: hypothetical protein VFA20_16560 [Myxococcaceae bacterium]|nr:hypothetical protein [Myxococcaceae bacterium]
MTSLRTVRCAGRCASLIVLALALEARAQEDLGLDLTSDTMDLRPTLAVVGVELSEGNPKRDGWILNYIGTLVSANADKSKLFSSVMKPDEVAQKLGDKYAEALKCAEDTCMVEIASALGVERVLTAQASHGATDSGLKLNAFTRATLAVQSATVDVKGPPHGDFFKKAVVALKPLFQSLSGKLAHLKVAPSLDTAKVTLGDRALGTGAVDVKVSAGNYLLKATAEGFSGQQQVTLEEGGNADLQLSMEPAKEEGPTGVAVAAGGKVTPGSSTPKPPTSTPVATGPGPEDAALAAAKHKPSGPNVPLDAYLKHPGTYVGAGGAVAILIGAGLGATAMATRGRAVDANRDGVLDITRSDAMAAQSQALIANVLFAAGALGLAGGGAWIFLQPPKGGGVAVTAGGTF